MRKILKSLIVVVSLIAMNSCGSATEVMNPSGKELSLTWELKQNGYENKGQSLNSFTVTNNSESVLKQNWTIYFHQPRKVVVGSSTENFTVSHISGDYFKLQPTEKFADLAPKESVELIFISEAWFLKAVDAPSGLYIVFDDAEGNKKAPEVIEDMKVLPLSNGDKLAIDGTSFIDVPTSTSIFNKNAKNKVIGKDDLCPITPSPISYVKGVGVYQLVSGAKVAFAPELENEADYLIESLGKDFGFSVVKGNEGATIKLVVDSSPKMESKSDEAYKVFVGENGIEIVGKSKAGVFYGVQSLRALVPVSAYGQKNDTLSINIAAVIDAPRFDYRGLHLDVVRNFQTKESVLKVIDMMSFYKLNKFHFHICDDEGWRLAIDGLPELTDVGSKRGHSSDESTMINPAYGSGPYPVDNTPGTGYYSREDFIEILKFAKVRHIEVIPELDFPGHARAAIISMKARQKNLLAQGKEEEANQYILHDSKDESTYSSIQSYNDNVVCVCQESTYDFLEKVVDEVVAMYKEAGASVKNVHIGGDEVPHDVWTKSPKCITFMEKESKYNKPEELFYYFVDRFSTILDDREITTAGWEEIGLKKEVNEDDDIVPVVNEEFLERNFHPYIWNTVWTWGAEDRGYKLANAGYKIVLANVNNLYFDLAYNTDPADPGYYWGGFVDTKKAWAFVPLNVYSEKIIDRWGNELPDSLQNGKERLTDQGKENIMGIQGQLWSETVKGSDMMEYYLFPKMLGLVERAWAKDPQWDVAEMPLTTRSQKDVDERKEAKIQSDWNVFSSKIGFFELQRLTYVNGGLNYRIAPAGAVVKDEMLHVNAAYPGFEIRYTTDGSEPTVGSTLYIEPVAIKGGVQVKLKVFNAKGRSSSVTVLR
ncbi:MAG: hexosaminidase [Saprospiraceae bacterium]|jgi:hexosaminidase